MVKYCDFFSALLLAFLLAFLPLKKLVNLYVCLLSTGLLLVANYISSIFINTNVEQQIQSMKAGPFSNEILLSNDTHHSGIVNHYLDLLFVASMHIVFQVAIVSAVSVLLSLRRTTSIILLAYVAPIIGKCLYLPDSMLPRMHNVASLIVSMISL